MEWITWFLFEDWRPLGAVLFVVDFALLVYWRRSGKVQPLLIALGVTVVLLVLQVLVVTRREYALRIMAGIEHDVVTAHTDALAESLAPGFRAGNMDRDEFVAFVRRQYDKVRVREVNCSSFRVRRSEADEFVVAADYQGEITVTEYAGLIRTRWEITFVRVEGGWQISAIEPVYIDGVAESGWIGIDRR
jgi:hypothetical protein